MILSDQTWHLVKNSSKVGGFVGGGKTRPPEVPEAEVMRVTQQMAGLGEKPKTKINFSVGEQVMVVDGPFSNFNGTVEDINEEKAKVKKKTKVIDKIHRKVSYHSFFICFSLHCSHHISIEKPRKIE